MPTLPTFTVTDPVAARILKAFEGLNDEAGNPLTPQQSYKRWLRQKLVVYVTETERTSTADSFAADLP